MSRFICKLSAVVALMVACGVASAAVIPVTSGLKVQLDASLGVTVTGSGVSQWNDQSGSNNNVFQTIDNQRPTVVTNALNGLPVIRFDGNPSTSQNDYLKSTNNISSMITNSAYTTFVVFKAAAVLNNQNTYNGDQVFGDAGAGAGYWGMFLNNPSSPRLYGYLYDKPEVSVSMTIGSYMVATTQLTGGTTLSTSLLGGGSNSGTGTTVGSLANPLGIGYGFAADKTIFKGDIAELLIYNRALTSTEMTDVQSYLNTKYFVAAAVPEPSSAALVMIGIAMVARRRASR